MKRALLLALLTVSGLPQGGAVAGTAAAEPECAVSAAEWSRPRSAAMVRALPGVRECVQAWLAQPARHIVLVSAPGEEGGLWANELRDWLVALGVPSTAIELRAVGTDTERLVLRIESALAP
jgi:hypothetical protein